MPKIKILAVGAETQSYRMKLQREKIAVGRKSSNDIVIEEDSISSEHCEIKRVTGGYILQDLDSTNGCKIKSQRYVKIDLEDDTVFRLGDVEVEFLFTDEEIDELEEEDEFRSEQKEQRPSKNNKRQKKQKNGAVAVEPSGNDIEQSSNTSQELAKGTGNHAEDDNDYPSQNRGFYITLVAFFITITASLLVLYLTGNL